MVFAIFNFGLVQESKQPLDQNVDSLWASLQVLGIKFSDETFCHWIRETCVLKHTYLYRRTYTGSKMSRQPVSISTNCPDGFRWRELSSSAFGWLEIDRFLFLLIYCNSRVPGKGSNSESRRKNCRCAVAVQKVSNLGPREWQWERISESTACQL